MIGSNFRIAPCVSHCQRRMLVSLRALSDHRTTLASSVVASADIDPSGYGYGPTLSSSVVASKRKELSWAMGFIAGGQAVVVASNGAAGK